MGQQPLTRPKPVCLRRDMRVTFTLTPVNLLDQFKYGNNSRTVQQSSDSYLLIAMKTEVLVV